MRNDDIIQSISYTLDLDKQDIVKILKLRGYNPRPGEVKTIFEKQPVPDDQEKRDTSHALMAHFLDGLIYFRRGKSDKHPPRPIQTPVNNNMVLKKLRVAFKLREKDMHQVLEAGGFSISKPEMSALFRRRGHKNYRECGDQILRYFLKGLGKRFKD